MESARDVGIEACVRNPRRRGKPVSHREGTIRDAAAKVRDLNFKHLAKGKGATGTAICEPNRASEGADKVIQRFNDRAI